MWAVGDCGFQDLSPEMRKRMAIGGGEGDVFSDCLANIIIPDCLFPLTPKNGHILKKKCPDDGKNVHFLYSQVTRPKSDLAGHFADSLRRQRDVTQTMKMLQLRHQAPFREYVF